MNHWHKQPLGNFLPGSLAIFRWLVTLVLVLALASCGDKAVSQQVPVTSTAKPQQISGQFSEVSPPAVIQELRSSLEIYQPQVTIVTPKADEVLSDNTVSVAFQVKDLPIFKHPQWELGPHLHVILDNQPYIPVYDLRQPLVLSDLSAGTHTLRVFASRPWHESFKNEGAYAQTTFHIFTKSDDNNPDPSLPLLTYSRPQGSYGAEPILLDFYLTNAPLHLATKDNPNDQFSDWRIRCTINGESFVFDRWQAVYLKGFKTGKNWVKLEFLDNQGNPVKNAYNTTVRLFNYQPKGKDTLSRIVRGELKADEVRGIVDPGYVVKPPVPEPTPTETPTPEPQPEVTPTPEITTPQPEVTPRLEVTPPQPEVTPTPEITTPQPEVTPRLEVTPPQPEVTPTPEITTPQLEVTPTQPEVPPTPEVTPTPATPTPKAEKSGFGRYFSRPRSEPSPSVSPTPQPEATVTPEPQPEVTPTPQATETPLPIVTPEPQPEETPQPEATETPVTQPKRTNLGDYFKRRPSSTAPTATE